MNPQDIAAMEGPDERAYGWQERADQMARERAYIVSARVVAMAIMETEPRIKRALTNLASDLEDADSLADIQKLLRWAESHLDAYGEHHQTVIDEILCPIIYECEELL